MPQNQAQSSQGQPVADQPPAYKIFVDGTEIGVEVYAAILAVAVDYSLDVSDMFMITLSDNDLSFINNLPFKFGSEIRIDMGHLDQLATMLVGEVTALEPEFPENGPVHLVVRGYDRMFRLWQKKRSRSFMKMKDSDIASQIASDNGLKAQVDATSEVHQYVYQNNQSDMAFLFERARRINYEVYIDNKNLYFRKPQSTGAKVLTFKRGENLKNFAARLTGSGQVSQVIVRGWDPRSKKEIIGKAKSGDEHTTLGGKESATKLSETAFGQTETVVVDRPIHSQAEADALARARFNELSMSFISAEGGCLGTPELRAGKVVEILGVGDMFEGLYYVSRARHYLKGPGYLTHFDLQRNSAGKPAQPAQTAPAQTQPQLTWIEVEVYDAENNLLPDADYTLTLPDGSQRTGKTDQNAVLRADNIPRGQCKIKIGDYEIELKV